MYVQVNQTRIAYQDQGQGLPVIFIHGFPLVHAIWDLMVPFLVDGIRVIAPDLRGFGQSDAPEGVYSMRLMASDIAGLMDQLGLPQAVLVGHSMGGYITLAFADAFPQRLLGMGLVATRASADTVQQRKNRFSTADQVAEMGADVVAESMPPRMTKNRELQLALKAMIQQLNPVGLQGALKGMAEREDFVTSLPVMNTPAAVVVGDSDEFCKVEETREMAGLLPRGVLQVIPGVGHLPMLEAPQATAEALNTILIELKSIWN